MTHRLYSDGTEKAPSIIDSIISLIIAAVILSAIYFVLTLLTNLLLIDELNTYFKFFYFIPFLLIFLYIAIKSRLPMLKVKKGKLITYKGVLLRDRVVLEDVRQIETELNNDNGIQLIIHFKSGFPSNFTAEIPINSCDDGQFVAFMKKYAPEVEVITQTNILSQVELKDSGLKLVRSNESIESKDEIDVLWQQFDFCKVNGEYKKCIDILNRLSKKGIPVHGNLGEMYLNGWHFDKNETKAYEQFKLGRNKDCIVSKLFLGYMYMNGIEVEQSYDNALELFKEIESYKIDSVYYNIGYCLLELGYEHTICKKYFLKAIAMNDPEGYIGLGHIAKKENKRLKSFCLYFKGARRKVAMEED